jgi:hypothetical protein
MKGWWAYALCAAFLLGCGGRESPPMKRMDGMRPVAPVVPAAPSAPVEKTLTHPLGGARPIPFAPASDATSAGAVPGATAEVVAGDVGNLPPDAELLRSYHAVLCHRRRGDESGVRAVWVQHGYTPASWAAAVRTAVMRAEEDSDGFGRQWAEMNREPCVP